MAVGDSSQQGVNSYLTVFREATWGTYPATAATNGTAIEFLSCNFVTNIDTQKLDTMGNRGHTKRVTLGRNVTGTLEMHLHPVESTLLLGVVMGGGIASSSLTGAYTHSISVGNVTDTAPTAVSFNFKKGATVFNYVGGRVNTLKIAATVGEVVKMSCDMVFKDSTIGATDITANNSYTSVLPFTFVNGVFRYNSTEVNAATTTSQEAITGFELTVNNNLKSDADARQLGSALLSVLPPTRRTVELKVTQRFDTTTTYNRFIQATQGSVELRFTGDSITSEHSNQMTIRLPKVFNKTGDTQVAGSGEILKTEIEYDVIVDTTTSAGREIGITVINNVGSYTSI